MYAILGFLVGLFVIWLLVWLCDVVARSRGLGGAHPLSPAVASALLIGTIALLGLFLAGIAADRLSDAASRAANASHTETSR